MQEKCYMFKKVILCILIVAVLVVGIYFSHFRRPPTADILAANLGLVALDDDEDYDVTDERVASQKIWDRWTVENKYVAIGKLFNNCNESTRIHIGRVIMLSDDKNGGVTSKTYVNFTLDTEVTGGLMYLTCDYNGNTLYRNNWDLCKVEEGMDDRIIFCPIKKGLRKYVKQLKIPNYLPKGHYSTKAWMTNQDGEEIGCALASFTI